MLNSFLQTLKLSNSIEELNIISELLETIDTFHDYFGLDESDLLNSAFDLENNQIDEFNKFNESYLLELRKCINNYNRQSPSAVILEPQKIKSVTVSTVSPSICHEVMVLDATILVF